MRLADKLNQARKASFTGRKKELGEFQEFAFSGQEQYFLLHYYGLGGLGKTTLLQQFEGMIAEQACTSVLFDGREIDPSPLGIRTQLTQSLGLEKDGKWFQEIEASKQPFFLLFDSFDRFQPIGSWLRQEFFPQLPQNTLIIMMGRLPLSTPWTVDPGWKAVIRSQQLRNLSQEESKEYLSKRALPVSSHEEILEFTHGHPLALSVVADLYAQQPSKKIGPENSPNIIQTLLEIFVQQVPSKLHRTTLEIAALVQICTESLLAEILGKEQASQMFEWLRKLSFIEQGSVGLFPKDLAREALIADLKWRNPDEYAELHHKIRNYFIRKIQEHSGESQRQYLMGLIFLHRSNPLVKPFFNWEESGNFWMDFMKEEDIPHLREMVQRQEGEESAQYFEEWVLRPESELWVWRETREPLAFVMRIQGEGILDEQTEDPLLARLLPYVKGEFQLREGENLSLFRFWMAGDSHQQVSKLQSAIFLAIVQYYFTPGLAVSMLLCQHPSFWSQVLTYADLYPLSEFDAEVDGNPYGWYYHDWRKRPPLAWLDVLGQREIDGKVDEPLPLESASLQVLILSEDSFAEAVQQALKSYLRPKNLQNNPLLQSRLVVNHTGEKANKEDRIEQLKVLLEEAIEELDSSPIYEKYHRAIYRTYINPVGSQERTAEYLQLSFSTFRRYVKAGIERIIQILWEKELEGHA